MESWSLSKHKLLLLILLVFMFEQLQGVCIEDERKALLEIKASLHQLSYPFDVSNLLSTWVEHEITHGDCCDWERIKCDTATGYITDLSLGNMFLSEYDRYLVFREYDIDMRWPLNFSPFLRFKELRSLDLSRNFIDHTIVSTGLDRLSSLNKLEILNLSTNNIETNIFPLLGPLTSLRTLDLSNFNGFPYLLTDYDISEFSVLENLEVLDLSDCGYYGTLQIQQLSNLTNLKKLDLSSNNLNIAPNTEGCKSLMRLERLGSVSLGGNNYFNARIISCLSFLPSLNTLDLSYSFGKLGSSVSMQDLSSLKELKELDLSFCGLSSLTINGTMSKLQHLNLGGNDFKDDIMRSMAAFPSLRYLSLEECNIGGRLFANEVPNMPYLQVLLLKQNDFSGTLPMEALASFPHLKVLDLSENTFVGSIPSTIKSLSSIEALAFGDNMLNGSLPTGLCELKKLRELDLSNNMFDGNLPKCFNWLSYLETLDISSNQFSGMLLPSLTANLTSLKMFDISLNQFSGMLLPSLTANLTSLKMFDISSNQFTGILSPSLIVNLKSLEYIDFGLNKFEGSFSFSSLSNHTKLEIFKLERGNEELEVETEEPIGWIPMFQLKVLVLPNGNIKKLKGSVVPSFLLHQHKLQVLDMSHNSLEGEFPNWLLENNTKLEFLKLRNNSLQGVLRMEYLNANMKSLDMSGNHITGIIHNDIQKFIPYIEFLNFSSNALNGVIPSSICDLHQLRALDLSENNFSGRIPEGLVTNTSILVILKLSKNALHGQILSGNLSLGCLNVLQLDNNYFTGNIGNNIGECAPWEGLQVLDISDNHFKGTIPSWISNASHIIELIVRNNRFSGQFPCGKASFRFLDISQNFFSGPLPYCLNVESMKHLHLGSNKFTGLVPNTFRNLTNVFTLDIGHNYLSGRIPNFLGDLSLLRILLLGNNNFSGSIPRQLCKLTNVSFIDLSGNSLSGLIPRCLHYNIGPKEPVFIQDIYSGFDAPASYPTKRNAIHGSDFSEDVDQFDTQDEAEYTTKRNVQTYKGNILDYMSGLDLSCNKLIGEIPPELGILTHIHTLNLSHNKLTGPIPVNLSNLIDIESLDLSFNGLTGKVPSELIQLKYLEVFNVSYNNLSGKLPEWKAQFATFTEDSYEGNPLLCGEPLKNKCVTESQMTHPSAEEGTDRSWYDIDMASFYGSFGSTWFVFMLGFAALIYINPYWRRRWLELVEECMFTCYYFLHDLVRKPSMIFRN